VDTQTGQAALACGQVQIPETFELQSEQFLFSPNLIISIGASRP
jgi:hypothetical protein